MIENICQYSKCTGCGACAGACPKNCISFIPDATEFGQLYPHIDHKLCIDCGLCQRICPANNAVTKVKPLKALAAYTLNESICNASSSGGLAYSISREIIQRGGVAYGSVVEYGSDFRIRHQRIGNLSELSRIQGSKYVYSRIDRSTYEALREDVIDGRLVLFTGTGCQIAGVRNFLKKDYPNFYAIDIICHGVPSLRLLNDYLSSKFDLSTISELRFRNSSRFGIFGKLAHEDSIKPFSLPLHKCAYMMGFLKGVYYRNACYDCNYAQIERCGDITLGDFWGLKKSFSTRPSSSDGTSVALVNTTKGEDLIRFVKSELAIMERPVNEAEAGNPQLRNPSKRHFAYNLFRRAYSIFGFGPVAKLMLIREKIFYAYLLPILSKIRR